MATVDRELLEFLQEIYLFKGLDQPVLERVAELTSTLNYTKGQTIFMEGASAEGFYIVRSGKVKIFKLSPDGREQILHIFGPGHPFGEAAAFSGMVFPANAEALSDGSALFISNERFTRMLAQDISIAMNMLAILSMRLRLFVRMIEDLSLKEVPGRLATYLLIESQVQNNPDFVQLDISKAQLASLLGTIPETLSRIFKKLQSMGLITVDRSKIILMDRAGLAELSGLVDIGDPVQEIK